MRSRFGLALLRLRADVGDNAFEHEDAPALRAAHDRLHLPNFDHLLRADEHVATRAAARRSRERDGQALALAQQVLVELAIAIAHRAGDLFAALLRRIRVTAKVALFAPKLANLILHDASRSRLPLWFDEGYAVYATGALDALDQLTLNYAVVRGTTPSLDSLTEALRGHPAGIGTAYALSATAVLELARRNPTGTLQPLMERLEAGVPFPDAVLATTGLTLDRFDEEWVRTIRQRYSLFTWLIAGGVWAVVGLGVIVGTHLRRRRDRPRRAALDQGWEVPEEEQSEAVTSLDQTPADK